MKLNKPEGHGLQLCLASHHNCNKNDPQFTFNYAFKTTPNPDTGSLLQNYNHRPDDDGKITHTRTHTLACSD